MKKLIISDKVQKEMLTDFMIMGETRGLIGGYCEYEFPVYYANEEMALMLGYDAVEEMVEAIDGESRCFKFTQEKFADDRLI